MGMGKKSFILLAHPSLPMKYSFRFGQIPLGLAYLKSYCEKNGIPATAVDFSKYNKSDIIRYLRRSNVNAVGISCLTETRWESIDLAKLVRKYVPNAQIIFGGVHATYLPEILLNFKYIDIVVRGEADNTLIHVCENIRHQRTLSEVKNVSFKEDGKLIHTPYSNDNVDLSSIPLPAYECFDLSQVSNEPAIHSLVKSVGINSQVRSANVITSRGCSSNCIYCSTSAFWGNNIRHVHIEKTIQELQCLISKYGVNFIDFSDDDFVSSNNHTVELCEEILKKQINIQWHCRLKVRDINIDQLMLMKKAGCCSISVGVESGSEMIRKRIRKNFKSDSLFKLQSNCKNIKIKTRFYIMIGNPGETVNSLNESINLVKHLQPDMVKFLILKIYPGTYLYQHAINQGIINERVWLNKNITAPLYTGDMDIKELHNLLDKCINSLHKYTVGKWRVGTEAQVDLKW